MALKLKRRGIKNSRGEIKLNLNMKSSRYSKDDYAKMSDGMIP